MSKNVYVRGIDNTLYLVATGKDDDVEEYHASELTPERPTITAPVGAVLSYDRLVVANINAVCRNAGAMPTVQPGYVAVRSDFLNVLMREYGAMTESMGGWRHIEMLIDRFSVGVERGQHGN